MMSDTLHRPGIPASILLVRALVVASAVGVAAIAVQSFTQQQAQSPQAVCEQALKAKLADPDSYRSVDGTWRTYTIEGKPAHTWQYRAKNGFGGYVLQRAACFDEPDFVGGQMVPVTATNIANE